ncbi:uncharacterized protein A4U43_C02F11090 [Asparagus officinalis]|uniref:Uncharacterized protein n=1 Tax=Asparagus officinalis TaxID=4686 RepID=A0A5P1FI99_ASPOF|nr:uncharacterized protein LOC109829473 [Asparagus officinalis]ONK77822.1 uncharacterized protein A4U43_C02F11090 [Asparagus officinalis]
MESSDENKKKLELIHVAINQLIEETNKKGKDQEEKEEESILLSRLLSQLDTMEKDAATSCLLKCPLENEQPLTLATGARESRDEEVEVKEIVKELRIVKRQNVITHCLLSVMIIVTAVWQFSEASLLLNMKEKVTHPIRAVGDMVTGSIKWKGGTPKIEAPPLPPISVPELPHMDLPQLNFNGGEE